MKQRAPGYATELLGDGIGLAVCGLFVPGVTMTTLGWLIATLVIALPVFVFGELLDQAVGLHGEPPRHRGVWALGGCSTVAIWIPLAPAIAERVTSGFKISGGGAYVVVVVVMLLSHWVVSPVVAWAMALVSRSRGSSS